MFVKIFFTKAPGVAGFLALAAALNIYYYSFLVQRLAIRAREAALYFGTDESACPGGDPLGNRDQIKNILIIKPGAIGDVLQLAPVVRALKQKYCHAAISLLVGSTATADLFKYNPYVRETIVFDKRGQHRSFRSIFRLRSLLRDKGYDLVINFQRSNLKTWFLASASLPCRLLVYHKSRNRNIHAVENHLETLAPIGIKNSDLNLELYTGEEENASAARITSLLGGEKPIIALNPGASHPVNRWGVEQFARLADMAAEKISARVIIVGGPEDAATADEIGALTSSKPLILAGKTSLLELAALLAKSSILVSGDTGPMHIAAAVGTRVVALFGAADPARTGPIGPGHKVVQAAEIACVPCRSRTCKNRIYRKCMEKITVESVFENISEMVNQDLRR